MTMTDATISEMAQLVSRLDAINAEIAARIATAGLRLRQDKVALRFVAGVRAGIARERSSAGISLFAITAPIKHPAKTIEALIHLLSEVPVEGLRATLHGNLVHARRIGRGSTDRPSVFGFVHNPHDEARLILDLAELVFNDNASFGSTWSC
jgi:hypothetical protein